MGQTERMAWLWTVHIYMSIVDRFHTHFLDHFSKNRLLHAVHRLDHHVSIVCIWLTDSILAATPLWNTPQGAATVANSNHHGLNASVESPHERSRIPTPNGVIIQQQQYDASTSQQQHRTNLKRERIIDSPISDISKRRRTPHNSHMYQQPSTSAGNMRLIWRFYTYILLECDGIVDNRRGGGGGGDAPVAFGNSSGDTYRLHVGADRVQQHGQRHDSLHMAEQQDIWKSATSADPSSTKPAVAAATRPSGDVSMTSTVSNRSYNNDATQFATVSVSPSCSSVGFVDDSYSYTYLYFQRFIKRS